MKMGWNIFGRLSLICVKSGQSFSMLLVPIWISDSEPPNTVLAKWKMLKLFQCYPFHRETRGAVSPVSIDLLCRCVTWYVTQRRINDNK